MSAPPFLLAAGLLFWGQQTGMLAAAAALAALLEAPRLITWRWSFSDADFHRISDLCTIFFAGVVVYVYSTKDAVAAIILIVQWMPLSLFPLAAAQAYSAEGRLDIGAFIMSLRKRAPGAPRRTVDASYPYLIACVLGAGAANVRTGTFYPGLCLLTIWALAHARPPGRSTPAWLGLVALAAGLGYAGQAGLSAAQKGLEDHVIELLFGGTPLLADPYQSRTSIGRLGELKQSEEIMLRVKPAEGEPPPAYLREASFDRYAAGRWEAREGHFAPVASGAESASWVLAESGSGRRRVSIAAPLVKGRGMLALPSGAYRLDGLPAAEVGRNRFGAVKIGEGPGLADFEARFDPKSSFDGPPDAEDLDFSGPEAALLKTLALELKLDPKRPERSLASVRAYFDKNFVYSKYQKGSKRGLRPLENFLLESRSGHCEFFATASVLLLRAGGIPARYATGYSIAEYSGLERAYIVRQRHAHAWALARVGGVWRDFDTTPMTWAAAEAESASFWRPVRDVFSWAAFKFARWRWRRSDGGGRGRLMLILLPILAIFLYRGLRGFRAGRVRPAAPPRPDRPACGLDSALFTLERALAEEGLGRRPWEAMSAWARRVDPTLLPLVALHDRHRFSARGLSPSEYADFLERVNERLAPERAKMPSTPL